MTKLIGTGPNQIPVNGLLGDMAFQSKDGLYIENGTANNLTTLSQLNVPNIYAAGTANNYFAGAVGIGSAPPADTSLMVAGTLQSSANASKGIRVSGTVPSISTSQSVNYLSFPSTQASAFTLTTLLHFYANQGTIGAGSTVTTQYGFNAESSLTGATNNYGFYSNIASGTNRWNFYAGGSAPNYFAGQTAIGSSTITAGRQLNVSGLLTGGVNAIGIASVGSFQSDVTTAGYGYFSSLNTQASSFTLPSLYHYAASQGTIGASSAVTNQFGFVAQNTLTGATNNYGFYSNIAYAANAYNFYAAGSAPNYFAGAVGIGVSPSPGQSLVINRNLTGSTSCLHIYSNGTIQSDVTSGASYFRSQAGTAASPFTLTYLSHYATGQTTFGSGSTVTNQYGFSASVELIGATNNYGFYSAIASASNAYNFYAAGSAPNYFAGAVGIGAVPVAGRNLLISPNMTGSVDSSGVYENSQIQSDVTSTAGYFVTVANTQASPFTLSSLRHFYATQGTIGAGSTVTNQYGFTMSSALTGATNNYGFYSNIASAANRYNFYAAGSADNYFAGAVGIGTTSLSDRTLGLAKSITGATVAYGITETGTIQSDVTSNAYLFYGSTNTAASAFTLTTATCFNATQGTIGSGSTLTNQIGFQVSSALTGATNNYGFYSNIASATNAYNFYAAGSASNYFAGKVGIGATPASAIGITNALPLTGSTSAYAQSSYGTVQSDVTTNAIYYDANPATAASAFTVNNIFGYRYSQGTYGAGSTVTSQFGFNVSSLNTGATNNYGFYSNIASASNAWNFYAAGSASNYFAGSVGIGTTSLSDRTLSLAKSITGATVAYGVIETGAIQSDVTSDARYFSTYAQTSASSFTLTTIKHYAATQGTIGAGSSVTNQFGFQADSSLTGATNNYGFYSNIASATNAYNFYAAGSASNYFAGSVGIGATTVAGQTLAISKNITGATTGLAAYSNGVVQSDVTTTAQYFATSIATAASAFTLPDLRHFAATQGTIGAGSTVTSQFGFHAAGSLTGATNNYGFYSNIASATNAYNFYAAGSAPNYFAGAVGIGGTPISNYKVINYGNWTGGTTYSGFSAQGTVQSDVTNNVYCYRTIPTTQATSFTLGNLIHYGADQSTIGSGSTVTTQYGFYAIGSLTGATNNYGFYSNIASAANRYNFYAAGSADNYFAGNVGIGTTSPQVPLTLNAAGQTTQFGGYSSTTFIYGLNRNASNGPNIDSYGDITFTTGSTTGPKTGTGRMTISSNGVISMYANISASNTSSGTLVVNGGLGVSSNVYANVFSSPVYITTSDITEKENVTPIQNSIGTLKQISGVGFNWKSNGKKSYGVIAQEIEKVLPELVHDNNGLKSVEYQAIIGFLIESIKDLSSRVEYLENK